MLSLYAVCYEIVFVSLLSIVTLSFKHQGVNGIENKPAVPNLRAPRSIDYFDLKSQLQDDFQHFEQQFQILGNKLIEKMKTLEDKQEEVRISLMEEMARTKEEIQQEVTNESFTNLEKQLKLFLEGLNNQTKDILIQKFTSSNECQENIRSTIDDILLDKGIQTKSEMENFVQNAVNKVETSVKNQIHDLNNQTSEILLQINENLKNTSTSQKMLLTALKADRLSHLQKEDIKNSDDFGNIYPTRSRRVSRSLDQFDLKIQLKNEFMKQIQSLNNTVNNRTMNMEAGLKSFITEIKEQKNSTKLEAINMEASLKSIMTEIKEQINSTKHDMETSIKSIMSEFNKQIGAVVEYNSAFNSFPTSPRFTSILEANKSREDQVGGCGGILVGDRGYISYRPVTSNTSGYKCIWTVRADLYPTVIFRLINGNVGTGSDFTLLAMSLQGSSKIISSQNDYTMDGPVVFVTLNSKPGLSFSPYFRLYYEGRGINTSPIVKQYRHYHYVNTQMEIDYPKMRGATNYSQHEVATFVVAPPEFKFNLRLTYIDTENNCGADAVTIFSPENNYYTTTRICARNYTLPASRSQSLRDAYIVTFTSDHSKEFTGFKFSWP